MRRRYGALILLALAGLLPAAGAYAHRLEAEYRVLPDHKVQVESWFDLGGDSPRGARVQVLRADGSLLTEGKLDSQGVYVFSYGDAEPLKVVVSAGAGHRKELEIPAKDLAPDGTAAPAAPGSAPPPASPGPRADRSARVSVKDVLIGVGFLLAVAAFALSLRNARQLRELKQPLR
jgi:nickel transport protein